MACILCIYSAILFSHEKEGNLAFARTWIDLQVIMVSDISQTEKDKYRMITYMWNKKQQKR